MKKYFRAILTLALTLTVLTSCLFRPDGSGITVPPTPAGETNRETSGTNAETDGGRYYMPNNFGHVKAMWISQFDLADMLVKNKAQRSRGEFIRLAEKMMENVASLGLNTVFVQTRPNGDSFYPSEIYPPSAFAVGKYGVDFSYEPFEILLAAAKKQGLSFHAWINPLRCMKPAEIALIDRKYPVALWYDSPELRGKYIVEVNGTLYLNPAYAAVRTLIAQGAAEILERYDVDGIHIDDYFYPTTSRDFDAAAYGEYKEQDGRLSLADFRRERINLLVAKLYGTVKARGNGFLFGISHGGNMNTNYNALYADVAKWCAEAGFADYICPQVYFGFEHQTFPFDSVSSEFAAMAKKGSVKLIIGMTLSKAYNGYVGTGDQYAGTGASEWIENRDVICRSLNYLKGIGNCGGVAFFSYRLLFDVLTGERVENTADEAEHFIPVLKEMY